MVQKVHYYLDPHVKTIEKTILSCDFTNIDSFLNNLDTHQKNILLPLIPKLKTYFIDKRYIESLKSQITELDHQLMHRIYDDFHTIPEQQWKIIEQYLYVGFKISNEPNEIVKTIIKNYFGTKNERFFSSHIETWERIYSINIQKYIDQLVHDQILLEIKSYDCPECMDGYIELNNNKKGTCGNCMNTFSITDLTVEYIYVKGTKYNQW